MGAEFGEGDRVELVRFGPSETVSELAPGDRGTVVNVSPGGDVRVKWDRGEALTLLVSEGDEIRLVEPPDR
jgi:hypothetical protein